ncbi:MAG: hypothetical protein PF495_01665 [Spirochaetales bacterium]|jgi:hypothetical protein|nr:hypothetical protein [Spirochaetales bacterium]
MKNKKAQGSKKNARKAAFLERARKRLLKEGEIMENGSIEELAAFYGVKLQ